MPMPIPVHHGHHHGPITPEEILATLIIVNIIGAVCAIVIAVRARKAGWSFVDEMTDLDTSQVYMSGIIIAIGVDGLALFLLAIRLLAQLL